jgi:hypothetical protein
MLEWTLYDNPSAFPPIVRAQLVDDAFNLAKAGQLNYTVPLDLTKYMIEPDIEEKEYLPWTTTLQNLQFLHTAMQQSIHFNLFLVNSTRSLRIQN